MISTGQSPAHTNHKDEDAKSKEAETKIIDFQMTKIGQIAQYLELPLRFN